VGATGGADDDLEAAVAPLQLVNDETFHLDLAVAEVVMMEAAGAAAAQNHEGDAGSGSDDANGDDDEEDSGEWFCRNLLGVAWRGSRGTCGAPRRPAFRGWTGLDDGTNVDEVGGGAPRSLCRGAVRPRPQPPPLLSERHVPECRHWRHRGRIVPAQPRRPDAAVGVAPGPAAGARRKLRPRLRLPALFERCESTSSRMAEAEARVVRIDRRRSRRRRGRRTGPR
jgi:hypothetical protein